ncbi:MAG: FxsA family protein [Proteobacteria bacterium]|nr:FxsA family protein [Pseudomonadota bacterium]
MDLNSIPALKAGLKKLAAYLTLLFLLEIGVFVLIGHFIGYANACWILVGSFFLGYIIRPMDYSLKPKAQLPTARKLASTLLMIPGYLTTLAGILVIIPPVRRLLIKLAPAIGGVIAKRVKDKLADQEVPSGLNESFAQQFKAAQASKTKRMSARRAQADGDIIDIDYEIEGGKNASYDTGYSERQTRNATPKALGEEEIIDVDVEWENK